MANLEFQNYRENLATKIKMEPDKVKRQKILEQEKETELYKGARQERERKSLTLKQLVGIIKIFDYGKRNRIDSLINENPALLNEPEVINTATQVFLKKISENNTFDGLLMAKRFPLPSEVFQHPKVENVIQKEINSYLDHNMVSDAADYTRAFHVSNDSLDNYGITIKAKKVFLDKLRHEDKKYPGAFTVYEAFSLADDFKENEEVVKTVESFVWQEIKSKTDMGEVAKAIKNFPVILTPEMTDMVKGRLVESFRSSQIHYFNRDLLGLPFRDELLADPRMLEKAEQELIRALGWNREDPKPIEEFTNLFPFSQEQINRLAKYCLLKFLVPANVEGLKIALDKFHIDQVVLGDAEVSQQVLQGIQIGIINSKFEDALYLVNTFVPDKEPLNSAVADGVSILLDNASRYNSLEFSKENIGKAYASFPDSTQAINEVVKNKLLEKFVPTGKKVISHLPELLTNQEYIVEIGAKLLIEEMNEHNNYKLEVFRKEFPYDVSILFTHPDVESAAKQLVIYYLNGADFNSALEVQNYFNTLELSSLEISTTALKFYIARSAVGQDTDLIFSFIKDSPDIREKVKNVFLEQLDFEKYSVVTKIVRDFPYTIHLWEEFLNKAKITALNQKQEFENRQKSFNVFIYFARHNKDKIEKDWNEILNKLSKNEEASIYEFVNLSEISNLLPEQPSEQVKAMLVKEIVTMVEIQEWKGSLLLELVQKFFYLQSPEIYLAVLEKSPFLKELFDEEIQTKRFGIRHLERVLRLFEKGVEKIQPVVEEYPFLRAAIKENKYGVDLLISFRKFGKVAKNNIAELYADKASILKLNPDIQITSPDFRKQMQWQLMEYGNNALIRESFNEHGIDQEAWLNYSVEHDFNLEAKGEQLISEILKLPTERIAESVELFIKTHKEAFKDFTLELKQARVPKEDIAVLQQKLQDMEKALVQAGADGNESKAAGIQKGIANLQKQIANPATVAAYDRMNGIFGALQLSLRDFQDAYNAIVKLETEHSERIATLTSKDRVRAISEFKAALQKFEKTIQEKARLIQYRVTNITPNLETLSAAALGVDRTNALLQEVQTNLGETLDHINGDQNTIQDYFDATEKESLDGRPVRMQVWSRDPDTDLYLGNYTDCCIRIDSEYHGKQSPISDYLTDLGIQVITITDEENKNPIVAAWCYTGIDNTGKVALVIDNIEANTSYSGPYKQQLERELRQYINNYASDCNIEIVSQGPHNNDLIVAKTEEKYKKLGWYNKPDGYYLEAEPDEVIVEDEENEE